MARRICNHLGRLLRPSSLRGSEVQEECGINQLFSQRTHNALQFSSTGGLRDHKSPDSFFELRTYAIKPHFQKQFLEETSSFAGVRKELNPGWLGFWTVETGGVLNEVKHLYYFKGGWPQRDKIRSNLANNLQWTNEYLTTVRPMIDKQESIILNEATECMKACGLPPSGSLFTVPSESASSPVYELRTYHLEAGYHSVPKLVSLFTEGLPSRIISPNCGQLMFMGFSDVGLLNVFIEIWRHESTQSFMDARKGARSAKQWRETISAVAPLTRSFTTELLRPTKFSPWN